MNPASTENDSKDKAEGEHVLANLLDDYRRIGEYLQKKESVMELTTRDKWVIIEMTKRVAGALCHKHERIREGVNQIMGGNVIELEVTKIWDQGRAEGRAEGRVEGRAEGRVEGRVEGRAEGIDERNRIIAQEMKANNEPIDKITKYTGLSKQVILAL